MKKFKLLILLCCICLFGSACTKQVVFLDRDLETTKAGFDEYIKSTGFEYKIKDDVKNIYNVFMTEYNVQFLLQRKPLVSYNIGFTCKFKPLGNDTLVTCTTYPTQNNMGMVEVRHCLKDHKLDDVEFVSYKKYQKMKAKKEL